MHAEIIARAVMNLEHLDMKGKAKEPWKELCEQAANEQDQDRLLGLVQEINRLLEEKLSRLSILSERESDGPSQV